jgi:hypothetical protein
MKTTGADNRNGSAQAQWPKVPKIASEEFQQSCAVAQLAVRLCDLKKASTSEPPEQENREPKDFLGEAWELIQAARKHVSQSPPKPEDLVERVLPGVPFSMLCDPDRKNEIEVTRDGVTYKRTLSDTETIHGIEWKVYRTKKAFYELFQAYWNNFGDKWRSPRKAKEQSKLKFDGNSVQMYTKDEREQMAALASDEHKWKARGKQVFDTWEKDVVPLADFFALAKFRREHDHRAANLPKKPKRKSRRLIAKG